MAGVAAPRAARSWGGPARGALIALAIVAILFLFVFPTRSYLSASREVNAERHKVEVLREQNDRLAAEANRLQTPSEIERLAREMFHMVFPGEQAYSVMPEAPESEEPTDP